MNETRPTEQKPTPNRDLIKQWLEQNNSTPGKLAQNAGVPRNVVEHIVHDERHGDFSPRKMTPEYRKRMYEATRLDFFKTTPQLIAGESVDLTKLYGWQQDLLNWMADHNYNQAMLQKTSGLGQGTAAFYCTKPSFLTNMLDKNKQALYKLTRLESLKGDGMTASYTPGAPAQKTEPVQAPAPAPQAASQNGSIDSLVEQVRQLTAALTERLPVATRPETDTELVQRTVAIYSVFVQMLENYKTRPQAVEQLKTAIPAQHAGYLMSCLNALYSKDAFGKWVLQQPMPLEVRK